MVLKILVHQYITFETLLTNINDEINLYAYQCDLSKTINMTEHEKVQIIGCCSLCQSMVCLLMTGMYWKTEIRALAIADTMNNTRWENTKLKSYFDNTELSEEKNNSLYKIKLFVASLSFLIKPNSHEVKLC